MPAYLLSWNPKRFVWEDVGDAVAATVAGQTLPWDWSTGNIRPVRRGERVFLLKQGAKPTGVVASGYTPSDSYQADPWDGDGTANMVDVEFDRILNPDNPLPTEFATGPPARFYWVITASGKLSLGCYQARSGGPPVEPTG